MGWRRCAVLISICLLVITGCADEEDKSGPAQDGPLRFESEPTRVGLFAPPEEENWIAMFGGIHPCTTGSDVKISRVTFRGVQNDQPVQAVLRTVTDEAARAGAVPVLSKVGAPEGAFGGAPGQTVRPSAGSVVTTKCSTADDGGFQELIGVFDVDPRGNGSSGLTISYSADGKDYVEHVEWGMYACPSSSEEEASCLPSDG